MVIATCCCVQVKTDSNRLLKSVGCECLKELEMAYPVSNSLHGQVTSSRAKIGYCTYVYEHGIERNAHA